MFSISLAQWSLHRMIFTGRLHPLDFPRFARDTFGIDAVEFVNRCFKDHYADDDLSWVREAKLRCDDLGVKSLLIMVDREGDLGDPDDAARLAAVENHYKWIEAACTLGCHSIRVNAGGPAAVRAVTVRERDTPPTFAQPLPHGRGSDVARSALADSAIDGLRRLCEFADEFGISILVENHGGLSSDGAWLADVIRRVDHPRCGTLPDFGNFCFDWTQRDDPEMWYDRYRGVAELMPFAKAVSAKSNEFNEAGEEVHIDYARMMRIVRDAGYRGHIGIEYEGPDDNETAGVEMTKALLERVIAALEAQHVATEHQP